MADISKWKKTLALTLALLEVFFCSPALAGSGLFPKSDTLFGVTMPDVRFALDREADDTEVTPEGEKLIYTSFTREDYEAFGKYVTAAGMKPEEQTFQAGTLTSVLAKDGSTITFQYCYTEKTASVFYPAGVRKEQEKNTVKKSGNILPSINRTFGVMIPSLKKVLKNHSTANTENRDGHDEIRYSGISVKDYNDINAYLTAIGCTLTESHVENGILNA